MRYYIITGTSSGLGEALAKQVITNKEKLFCISRKFNNDLKDLAVSLKTGFWYFEQDLTQIEKIPALMEEIFSYIDRELVTEIVLINNAGIIEPVKPLGKFMAEEINYHISINLSAPLVLTNELLRLSSEIKCKKTIVSITSGAASNPYHGWSLYCSSKAGLNMMTKVAGLEQNSEMIKVFAVAPGVVDTNMQTKIRQVSEEDFPMKSKFVKLHSQERLIQADTTAHNILDMIHNPSTGNGYITDLRNKHSN